MAAYAAVYVAGTALAYNVYSGERASAKQDDAMADAKVNQAKTETAADQAMNKANPKKPNTLSAMSSLQQAAKGGPSGTMLTGPSGVDASTLTLGRSTLLGG
jgi:hypothetical protein